MQSKDILYGRLQAMQQPPRVMLQFGIKKTGLVCG
jgi:hypothetical protein